MILLLLHAALAQDPAPAEVERVARAHRPSWRGRRRSATGMGRASPQRV